MLAGYTRITQISIVGYRNRTAARAEKRWITSLGSTFGALIVKADDAGVALAKRVR